MVVMLLPTMEDITEEQVTDTVWDTVVLVKLN